MALSACDAPSMIAVCGRRFGKTRWNIITMATDAIAYPDQVDPINPCVVMGALPTLVQAKVLLWEPLVSLFSQEPFSQWVKSINRSEHVIHLQHGKPSIYVRGANDQNGDRLRGFRFYRFHGDEYQDYKAGIRENIILPALADTPGSKERYTCTPKGRSNIAYKLYQALEADPKGAVFQMPSWTNPSRSLAQAIEGYRQTMPPRVFRQEFGATFESFPGQIYYELSESNKVPTMPSTFDLVVIGHDFGDVNPAIVVLGRKDMVWYILEGWYPRANGQPVAQPTIDRELLRLAHKWRVQATYCDPSRPSSILAVRQLDHPGLKNARAGYNPIEEGLGQVHSLIYQLKLVYPSNSVPDTSAALNGYHSPSDIYDEMLSYHRPTDQLGNVEEGVEDGQTDHLTDAVRMALAAKNPLF